MRYTVGRDEKFAFSLRGFDTAEFYIKCLVVIVQAEVDAATFQVH